MDFMNIKAAKVSPASSNSSIEHEGITLRCPVTDQQKNLLTMMVSAEEQGRASFSKNIQEYTGKSLGETLDDVKENTKTNPLTAADIQNIFDKRSQGASREI